MKDTHDPFRQALEAYRSAVYAKDVDAFAAIYDDDVQVFDMWGAWSLRGIGAWRGMAEGWFASLGDERVVVDADEIQSTVADDMAVGHAILTYAAVSAAGETLRSLNNRITMAMKSDGGSWKIFHEHTSAPIDHGTIQAILKREESR